jgi:hypothetical protein
MPRLLRYCLIVLALVALAFTIWNGLSRDPQAAGEGAAPRADVPAGATGSEKTAGDFRYRRRAHRNCAGAQGARVGSAGALSKPATHGLRVRIRTSRSSPRVSSMRSATPCRRCTLFDPGRDGISATSDAAGRIALDVPQPFSETSWSDGFTARRKGYATKQLDCRLTLAETTPLGDVVLAPGLTCTDAPSTRRAPASW